MPYQCFFNPKSKIVEFEKQKETIMDSRNPRGVEGNVIAIIEATASTDSEDANDDRIAFLQAVRSACVTSFNPTHPTYKMFEAVFQILRVGKSLELLIESFWLLNELDKRFPRVYVSNKEASESCELVVVEEAWSPLVFNLDVASSEKDCVFGAPFDPSGFELLIKGVAELASEADQANEIKSLGNMLLLQYIVNVLEGDFIPRNRIYNESMNWIFLRESCLNMLLSSRKLNYKGLMKDCLSIICGLWRISTGISSSLESPDKTVSSKNGNIAAEIALLEAGINTCSAMQKLLAMIMELDMSRKRADMQGSITRADGVRTPLVEIILDELTYDSDILPPFFQAFVDPKWKLAIISHYVSKYAAKSSVRTRRSNGSSTAEDAPQRGALKCFSNIDNAKNFTKKIGTDVVQVLLAHAFKAHLSLSLPQQNGEGNTDSGDKSAGNSLVEICEDIISSFSNLKSIDKKLEILPLGKEALFTAMTILSMKSNSQV